MSWAMGTWLMALWGVLSLGMIVWFAGGRHRSKLATHFSGAMLQRVLPLQVRVRRNVRDIAAIVGLAALVIALAEPRAGKEIIEVQTSGIDLVLCLDLSRSMDAEDVDPSRIERMRREVRDFAKLLPGDRVGLVVYAGAAYPRMPLTRDKDALRLLVQELDTDVFTVQGSALGEAIRMGVELLNDDTSQAGKAMIVLSDGEVHDVADALAAAAEASAAGVRIFSMGIGTKGAPIPLPDGTWLQYKGQTVISTPSVGALRDVARVTGGAFVPSVASMADVQQLVAEIRGTVTAEQTGVTQREVWSSRFQWPLGLGLGLLLLAAWIGDGRTRLRGSMVAVFFALMCVAPQAALAQDKVQGDVAYRSGQFAYAADIFENLVSTNPTDPDLYGRLGAARYRMSDFEGAARAWETQSRLMGSGSTEADFNAAAAHYRSGRLEQAIANYERVLDARPNHRRADSNLKMVAAELEARRKEQPENDEKKDGQGGQSPENEGSDSESEAQQKQESGDEGDSESDQTSDEGEPEESEGDSESSEAGEPESSNGAEGDEEDDAGSETADLDDIETVEDGATSDETGPSELPAQNGEMTPEQAGRLLDGVEEGHPRIRVSGGNGGKPW